MKQAELETTKNRLEFSLKWIDLKYREGFKITTREYGELLNELGNIKPKPRGKNMLKINKVQSSNVVGIGHDGKDVMRVQYRGDSFYDFEGVSVEDFGKLQKAKSVGSHLHKMGIKGTKIITTKCPECGKVAMMKVGHDIAGTDANPNDVENWECLSCGHTESC